MQDQVQLRHCNKVSNTFMNALLGKVNDTFLDHVECMHRDVRYLVHYKRSHDLRQGFLGVQGNLGVQNIDTNFFAWTHLHFYENRS